MELSSYAPTTHVFISYSRKDQHFVSRLATSLQKRAFVVDWDQSTSDPDSVNAGISAEDEWWTRLQELIVAADVMVLVVSPDSASSRVCDEEIAYAHALGKRVIAILYRAIDFRKAPPRLAALNVKISFVEGATSYDDATKELSRALLVDVGWLRESTRLTEAATRWTAGDRENDRLLQGTNLRMAERWAARRPASAPPVSGLVLDYLEASRSLEEERRAISEAERIRYQEIDRVTREFLEEEAKYLESMPVPEHLGVADEMSTQKDLIRSLLGHQIRWHPRGAQHVASTGAREGYAEIFEFPCCGKKIMDFLATSNSDAPSQFRVDGCDEIPESIQYQSLKPSNPFHSMLLADYRRMKSG